MRIKLLHPIACPHGTGNAGQVVELPEPVAASLVDNGYAVQLDLHGRPMTNSAGDPLPAIETASLEPERETASVEPAPTSKKKRK